MPPRASKVSAVETSVPENAEESGLTRTLDWLIRTSLPWPYLGWASDGAPEYLLETLQWLDVPEEDQVETMTMLINLAAGYRAMLDQQRDAGSWKESAQRLGKLAKQARALASSIDLLEDSERLMWAQAEASSGTFPSGSGLFPTIHPERMPSLSDLRLVEGQGLVSCKLTEGPAMTPPELALPILELADRLDRVVEWIEIKRKSIGLRTTADIVMGSPELDLLWNAKTSLAQFGLDPARSYRLGRRIHQVVTGGRASRYWGNDSHRKVEAWYAKVGPWVGREKDVPEDIRVLLRKGPKAIPPRVRR